LASTYEKAGVDAGSFGALPSVSDSGEISPRAPRHGSRRPYFSALVNNSHRFLV
jgi:hypothetical protein